MKAREIGESKNRRGEREEDRWEQSRIRGEEKKKMRGKKQGDRC